MDSHAHDAFATVRLPSQLAERTRAQAEREDRSVSSLIRQALRSYVQCIEARDERSER